MAHYTVIGKQSGNRYDRAGRPVQADGDEANIPAVSLASAAAHVAAKIHKEAAGVWKVDAGGSREVAVYFPDEVTS